MNSLKIDSKLYSILSGDAPLQSLVGDRIWGHAIPAWSGFPCVVFTLQNARDLHVVDGYRVMLIASYQVKGVDSSTTWSQLNPIAERIDALLHDQIYTDTGYRFLFMREGPVEYVERHQDSVEYRHLGGLYRVYMTEA